MQHLYLHDLLKIERLCVQLNILQPKDGVVQKLKAMVVKHIRPLVAQLKVLLFQ